MRKILFVSVTMVLLTLALSACFHKTISSEQIPEQTLEVSGSSTYVNYSQAAFDAASDKKRVYYFHAKWCPSCRVINKEFTEHTDQIPEDVVVFKTDYDTETELKEKYSITYQHTFVYVDADGNEIKKWNGGGIDELIANTKS